PSLSLARLGSNRATSLLFGRALRGDLLDNDHRPLRLSPGFSVPPLAGHRGGSPWGEFSSAASSRWLVPSSLCQCPPTRLRTRSRRSTSPERWILAPSASTIEARLSGPTLTLRGMAFCIREEHLQRSMPLARNRPLPSGSTKPVKWS